MMKRWVGFLVLSVALFMCGASFASTFTDPGIYAADPTDTVMVYTVDPPLVPAVMPADNVLAMACGGKGKGKGKPRLYLISADQVMLKTVLACGTRSKPIEAPMKIPIRA